MRVAAAAWKRTTRISDRQYDTMQPDRRAFHRSVNMTSPYRQIMSAVCLFAGIFWSYFFTFIDHLHRIRPNTSGVIIREANGRTASGHQPMAASLYSSIFDTVSYCYQFFINSWIQYINSNNKINLQDCVYRPFSVLCSPTVSDYALLKLSSILFVYLFYLILPIHPQQKKR